MKRIPTITILIIVFVSIFTCFVFANNSEEQVAGPGNADYVEASSVTSRLTVNNGEAVCKTYVDVISGSSANKMVVTVKYIKQNVGTVGTRTATVYKSGTSFTATTRMALTSSGTYHCKVTIKLYNGSTLLETISALTNSFTY